MFSLISFGFFTYILYDGYKTRSVFNPAVNEYTPESARKYSDDDSPILYWMCMMFWFAGWISVMWLPVSFYKHTSKYKDRAKQLMAEGKNPAEAIKQAREEYEQSKPKSVKV